MVPKTFVILFLCFFCTVTKVISASKYTVMTQSVSYFDAVLTCKVAGMDLVSIETLDEWQDIVDLLGSLGYEHGSKLTNYLWTSGNSLNEPHSRNFSWMSDGSLIPRDELFWSINQPDDANTTTAYDEQCVNIRSSTSTNNTYTLGLNDYNCNFKHGFICERPEKCQNRSTFSASKYEIRSQNATYFDAVSTCKQSGKDLVSVETLDEWQEIVRLLRNLGYDSQDGYLFWTSGNSLNEPHSRNFHWMSDGSLIPRGKLFWGKGQPDNANSTFYYDEQCVEIQHFDGTFALNDYNCHFKHGFICEDREDC